MIPDQLPSEADLVEPRAEGQLLAIAIADLAEDGALPGLHEGQTRSKPQVNVFHNLGRKRGGMCVNTTL